uniref:T-cell receptor T3 zeta chain n=1 Tax=Sinocyclocheilus rhinocerous TaxID=307959 RepID=A0A673LX10_9TELE
MFIRLTVYSLFNTLLFLCFSAFSFYDPNLCYILDALFLLYGVIITAFFVRDCDDDDDDDDGLFQPLQKKSDDTYREIETKPGVSVTDSLLLSVTKDTYDSLHMQQIHPPPR